MDCAFQGTQATRPGMHYPYVLLRVYIRCKPRMDCAFQGTQATRPGMHYPYVLLRVYIRCKPRTDCAFQGTQATRALECTIHMCCYAYTFVVSRVRTVRSRVRKLRVPWNALSICVATRIHSL
ncbi:hypothetical protein EVAR_3635_1 [Eumeta japonica]|uniref:Uncharacterized protein n=1 Tax=Eumeta variegata TaxID=151549 RepID=A0A4C1SVQ4_EUMVA|nr:hypothetical protein EVAR_3635_1 [Eumeta japonica]